MVSLFLLLGCNLSYIVDLFAALHELASASSRTLLKPASSVRALLKPYGDTLTISIIIVSITKFSIVIGSPRVYLSRNRARNLKSASRFGLVRF